MKKGIKKDCSCNQELISVLCSSNKPGFINRDINRNINRVLGVEFVERVFMKREK